MSLKDSLNSSNMYRLRHGLRTKTCHIGCHNSNMFISKFCSQDHEICSRCLSKRYDIDVRDSEDWPCPVCDGLCTCEKCPTISSKKMKKKEPFKKMKKRAGRLPVGRPRLHPINERNEDAFIRQSKSPDNEEIEEEEDIEEEDEEDAEDGEDVDALNDAEEVDDVLGISSDDMEEEASEADYDNADGDSLRIRVNGLNGINYISSALEGKVSSPDSGRGHGSYTPNHEVMHRTNDPLIKSENDNCPINDLVDFINTASNTIFPESTIHSRNVESSLIDRSSPTPSEAFVAGAVVSGMYKSSFPKRKYKNNRGNAKGLTPYSSVIDLIRTIGIEIGAKDIHIRPIIKTMKSELIYRVHQLHPLSIKLMVSLLRVPVGVATVMYRYVNNICRVKSKNSSSGSESSCSSSDESSEATEADNSYAKSLPVTYQSIPKGIPKAGPVKRKRIGDFPLGSSNNTKLTLDVRNRQKDTIEFNTSKKPTFEKLRPFNDVLPPGYADGPRYNLSERDRQYRGSVGRIGNPVMHCIYVSNSLIMDASLANGYVMGKYETSVSGLEIGDKVLIVEKMRCLVTPAVSGYPLVSDVNDFNGICRRILIGTVIGDRYYCLDSANATSGLPYPYRCSVSFDLSNPETFQEEVEFSTFIYPSEVINTARLSIACGGKLRGRPVECPLFMDKLILQKPKSV